MGVISVFIFVLGGLLVSWLVVLYVQCVGLLLGLYYGGIGIGIVVVFLLVLLVMEVVVVWGVFYLW